MRALLDANVLVSAALSARGAPARLIKAWLSGEFELVVSPALLGELERVLAYPKIRSRIPQDDAAALLELLRDVGLLLDDPDGEPPVAVSDPDDRYLVVLAASARAILVTGDAALLRLAELQIPVCSPAAFEQTLRSTN